MNCNPFENPYARTFIASFLAVTAGKSDLGIPELDMMYQKLWFKLVVIGTIVYLNSCDVQVTAVIMAVIIGILHFKGKLTL